MKMNRNVTILIIVLMFLVAGGFLLWLRGKFQVPAQPVQVVEEQITATPTINPTVTIIASPSATATPSGKKSPTPTKTPTKSPTKAGTSSGRAVSD